jgi:DNA-directed RNA polymerase specialized sigma24 family protein
MMQLEERDARTAADFAAIYENERGRIYRALVLATGNRDLAVDAVDRGFTRWHSRKPSRRGEPVFEVFSTGYGWAARRLRKPDRMVQGFRLSRPVETTESPLLTGFDELELGERALLVGIHFLGWTAERAGAAAGIPGGEALPRAAAAASRLARNSGVTVNDVDATLPAALAARAETLIEPLQRAEAVEARARRRRIGLLGGAGLGLAAVVTLAAVGGSAILGSTGAPGDPSAATDGTDATPPADASIFTAGDLIWERVPMPIRQGEVSAVAFGPSGFVAIGQDWSTGNGSSIALISSDGLVWDAAPGPVEGPNAWAHQLTFAGDKYVVVGSAFNEAAGTDSPFIAVSDDALSWAMVDLPTAGAFQINGREMRLHTWIESVVATDDRVMVVANQNLEFDPAIVFEEALGEDISLEGWGMNPQGIEILGNNGEVERRISWDELGLDDETAELISGGRPLLFTSTDMVEWEAITITGMTGSNHHIAAIVSSGDAFAAVVYGDFGPALWTSPDGAQWTETETFEPGASINSLATVGDRTIALGTNVDGQSTAWASSDLTTWERTEIPFGGGWFQQVRVSSAGVAILGEENQAPTQPVEIVVGDLTVLAAQAGGFAIQDADGNEIARVGAGSVAYTEEGSIELRDPDTDELLVTLDQRELEQAWEAQWREFDQLRGEAGPSYTLLLSENGTEWTRLALNEQIGNGFYPNAVAVGDDAIVITGFQEGGPVDDVIGGNGVSVWVGTLP